MTIEKERKAADLIYEMGLLRNDLRVLKHRHSECQESESSLKLASVPVSVGLFCIVTLRLTRKKREPSISNNFRIFVR